MFMVQINNTKLHHKNVHLNYSEFERRQRGGSFDVNKILSLHWCIMDEQYNVLIGFNDICAIVLKKSNWKCFIGSLSLLVHRVWVWWGT